MTREGAIAVGCFVLALACAIGALRCLADRLLVSAACYTALAIGLVAGAAKVAADAL